MNKLGLLLLFLTFTTITSFAQAGAQMDAKAFFNRMNGKWKADTDQSTTSEMLPKLQESNVTAKLTNTGNSILLESESRYLSTKGEEIPVSGAFFFAVGPDNKVYALSTSAEGNADRTEGVFKDGKMILSWGIPGNEEVDEARATLYFDTQGQLHYLQEFDLAAGGTLARKSVHVKQ